MTDNVSAAGQNPPADDVAALAVELWRVKGCPPGGMPAACKLAAEILRAGEHCGSITTKEQ
jgi:hypothetical protein